MKTLKEMEIDAIQERLVIFDNDKREVARSLGISLKSLYNHIGKYNIASPSQRRGRRAKHSSNESFEPTTESGEEQDDSGYSNT